MSAEVKKELHLEIAYVLFIEVVGFSKRGRPVSRLRNWLQVLTRDRLDNVPILAEHLNVTAAIARTLLSVIQSVLACVLAAVDRLDAFSFKNFRAAFLLPSRIP